MKELDFSSMQHFEQEILLHIFLLYMCRLGSVLLRD
jgi:hypothetical protein